MTFLLIAGKQFMRMFSAGVLVLFLLGTFSSTALGQRRSGEYVIGIDDVLSITFWQAPELNTTARVGPDGEIELPIIGRIRASGLTPARLSEKIIAQLSVYNREITQATVQVTQYGSKYLYVVGQVTNPGKYTFQTIPNLWEILLEAGGPLPGAKLTQITIIRGEGPEAGQIIHVNLTEKLERGDLSALPPVYPGDTIQVPAVGESALGVGLSSTAQEEFILKDVIYIFGAVANPGAVPYQPQVDLLEALILAGGPTAAAQLSEVHVVSRGLQSGTVLKVNLEDYAASATPVPVFLQPRDVIYIPERRPPPTFLRVSGEFLRITVSAATSALIFILLR